MPTTSRGYPFPVATDPPAGHTQIYDLASAINTDVDGLSLDVLRGVPKFLTEAERDAAYSAVGGASEGDLCFVSSAHQLQCFSHAGQWSAVGGQQPMGGVRFGASALTPGVGRLALTPELELSQGGVVWDNTQHGFRLPTDGHWLMTLRMTFTGVAAATVVQALAGRQNAHDRAGSYGASVGGTAASTLAAVAAYANTWFVCPWYYTSAAASLGSAEFSIKLLTS